MLTQEPKPQIIAQRMNTITLKQTLKGATSGKVIEEWNEMIVWFDFFTDWKEIN